MNSINTGTITAGKSHMFGKIIGATLVHSLSKHDGIEVKQKQLYYVFVGVYANLYTVMMIELTGFLYHEIVIQQS